MQVNQGVRTKAARRISIMPALAMAAALSACGGVPLDSELAGDSAAEPQEASHIKLLADPNVGLTFAGTSSYSAGTLTLGLTAGDVVVVSRAATNTNILINGNSTLGATVGNTNIISIAYSSGGPQQVVLDYINGFFGQGNKTRGSGTWGTFFNTQGNVNDTLSIRMPNPTPAGNTNITFSEAYADLNNDSVTDISFTKTGTGFIPTITVELGAGNDQFTGAGGLYSTGTGSPVGTTADTSSGAVTQLHVFGGAGNDNIICGKGNDTLHGGAGNDSFNGGATAGGPVSFFGDDGTDSLSFALRSANLTLALNSNNNSGALGENITIGLDIENLTGGAGNDVISGSPILGLKTTLTGGPGNDTFLQTGAGNDSNDTIVGGAGIDTVDYSARSCNTNVTLDGSANDGCVGENDNVGADVENVTTGSGADYIVGSALDNRLNGGTGANYLSGGAGDDIFDQGTAALNTGADTISGGAGEDVVDYSGRTAAVTVALNNTATSGESGEADKIAIDVEDGIGGAGADTLTGNVDDNVLNGGPGSDTVTDCGGGSDLVLNCEALSGNATSNCGITLP